jgi:hypothetical protein
MVWARVVSRLGFFQRWRVNASPSASCTVHRSSEMSGLSNRRRGRVALTPHDQPGCHDAPNPPSIDSAGQERRHCCRHPCLSTACSLGSLKRRSTLEKAEPPRPLTCNGTRAFPTSSLANPAVEAFLPSHIADAGRALPSTGGQRRRQWRTARQTAGGCVSQGSLLRPLGWHGARHRRLRAHERARELRAQLRETGWLSPPPAGRHCAVPVRRRVVARVQRAHGRARRVTAPCGGGV